MSDAQLRLVIKAISCRVIGCVEWEPRQADRLRGDPDLQGLTPEEIQRELIEYVASGGGKVRQVKEKRPQWSHREFYYKAIVPFQELFRKGLFVEMELH